MHPARLVIGALFFAACASMGAAPPAPPVSDSVAVDGDLPRAGRVSMADLEALGAEDVEAIVHNEPHLYRGVRLDKVIAHFGFEGGPGGRERTARDRHAGWRCAVVASAADGFQAVFAAAELMPEIGPTRAYVAWRRDGAALPAEEGPLRLVVPTDRKGSRGARLLTGIRVLDLRPVVETRDPR